jgi:hypothetical protein
MVCLNHLIAAFALAVGMAGAATTASAAPASGVSFADASHSSAPGSTVPPALHTGDDDGSFADAANHPKSSHEQERTLRDSAVVVPEPGTPLLLLAGALTMAISLRRRRPEAEI